MFSPCASGPSSRSCSLVYGEPVVQSELTRTPKLYFDRSSGSTIASHSFSGVVLM
jgi:hypothetical protein